MDSDRLQTFHLLNQRTGSVIADRAVEAVSFRDRLVGLLGRSCLLPGEALVLRANGVHTFGMRFAIDVVILDREGRVLRTMSSVRPNRIVWPLRGGHSTVELGAGAAEVNGIRVGDRLLRSTGNACC